MKAGDLEAALRGYQDVLRLHPGHIGALGDIVLALSQQGRITDAIAASKRAIATAPSNSNLRAQLGQLLIKRKNWHSAEATFNDALVLEPAHAGALGGLASVYSHQGKSEEALALLLEATTHHPSNAGMHVRYGQALEDHHRLAAASSAYATALSVDKSNKPAEAGLRRVRDPHLVFRCIEAACSGSPDEAAFNCLAVELNLQVDDLHALLRFMRAPDLNDADALGHTAVDRAALRCICESRRRRSYLLRTGAAAPVRRLQVAEADLDCLAQPLSHESWAPSQWLAAFEIRQTVTISRVAAVVTMRDEGLYILEWIAHYRALGVDTIFVYSNDNIDGSDSLLRALAQQGVIIYIENQIDRETNHHPQRKAYAHALQLMPELWEHEWVLFFDCDEFLIPTMVATETISKILDEVELHHPERPPSAICFNWNWRLSGSTYAYTPDLLLKRFPHGVGKRGMKSLVRLKDVYSMHSVHFPDYCRDGFLIRSDFTRMEKSLRWKKLAHVPGCAQLHHYWNKSFEEFSLKKARGDAAKQRDKLWDRSFDMFFMTDNPTNSANLDPASEELCDKVEAQLHQLRALPNIKELQAEIRDRFPRLLDRFEAEGGLRTIFTVTQAATAGQYAPGFAPATEPTAD